MYIDVRPYILLFELYLKISEITLTDESFYTLCEFAKKDSSVYEISNTLKSTEFKTNYTNVFTKIKRFQTLGLIEKTEKMPLDNLHSAIYYRLTLAGIFCIFYS